MRKIFRLGLLATIVGGTLGPSVTELLLLTGFGVVGFVMRRYDYPIAPAVVGLILGPLADSALRRSLQMSLGDPMILLQHPSSAIMIGIALVALVAPFVFRGLAKFRQDED